MPFAVAGYPIEVVVLAVRRADSRLATVLRYARALQVGAGRFTSQAGHDQCFNALPDVVALAEEHPAITAVTVIRRDGRALLRHEAGSPGRARWMLESERNRPYTEQEGAAFFALYRGLRQALPQLAMSWTTSRGSPAR
ncbi:hypothetical protein AQ490_25525 [Wenjunlia vitaminophila]|uniref:UDP-N-acetylglucosamine kinase n=1 Tax=Wenjunlia vitaminophila TaxID=76728 RepID=A0A0T6LQQ0_WENVI|nr:zeta toxin family protein [Wenjunlia vitaminophila]KRV48373.1 hypothetical protein AQ490_25525 [Wenjunlia vitaminophila]